MKKVIYLLLLLAMNAVLYAAPLRAQERGINDAGLKEEPDSKDECLLVAINCGTDIFSLEQKIEKLRQEISKGRAVYSDDELSILREKLNNARKTLEYFKYEGAGNLYKYPGE